MAQKPRSTRWTGWLKRKPSLVRPFPNLRFEELEARVVPATYTWRGLGATPNWSDPANWIAPPSPAPQAPTGMAIFSEDLVFPEGPTVRTTVNDLLSGTFNSISFSTTTAGAGYTLTGNPITLGMFGFPGTGFINVNLSSTGNNIQFNTTLGAGTSVQSFTVNGGLTVSGALSGANTSSLIKAGTGTLTLSGDNINYLGTIAINADSGNLVVANPNALGDTLRGTTIGTNSSLRLVSGAGVINEPILLNGPGSDSFGALFNDSGNNTWNGPITLGTGSATAGIVVGAAGGTSLAINSVISDTGTGQILSKEGQGEVQLNAANTYRGLTLVQSGILTVGHANALGLGGTAASGTIVNSTIAKQGQLRLAAPSAPGFTILDEFLTLNGAGQAGLLNRGSLTNTNADNTWAGPITLGSPTPNGVAVTIGTGGGTLTISGVISTPNGTASPNGSSSLTKIDTGTLIFNNANTYACPTFIAEGVLTIRDSRSLGTNSVSVSSGATLRLEVEAGAGPNGSALPNFDAHGRNLSIDSVTGDAHRLQISNTLSLSGQGVLLPDGTRAGALYSQSGINVWTSTISSGAAGIGVALDPRPGHPTPDSSYFVNDYSLTTTAAISGSTVTKLQPGHLIWPVANTYTGRTFVESGWITVQHNRALGGRTSVGQTLQPETFVRNGAALHLRTLTPFSAPLFIDENLILSGVGPKLPYRFISEKGALMNIGGDNILGVDSLLSPIWFGYTALNGMVGIGVEQVAPLVPGPGQDISRLSIIGWVRDDQVNNPAVRTSGGIIKLGSMELQLQGDGTYSLDTDIREGAIRARNNAALGQATSGTYSTSPPVGSQPQTYTQTTTTVQSAANLRLDQSIPMVNGGIGSSIQVVNEKLILNGTGQQVAVAGSLVPAPSQFFLTFQNNLIGPPATTAGLRSGLPASELEAELMKLPSIKGSEIQSVTVGGSGTFELTYQGQTTPVGGLSAASTALAVQNALNALSSIRRNEVQTVDVLGGGPLNSFTLSFNGQTTAPIAVGSAALTVEGALNALTNIGATGVTVTSAAIAGGTRYTVTFGGGFVSFQNVPQMTSTGIGIANPVVATAIEGLNGSVTVTRTPGVPTGAVFTVTFGGDLAFQNLNPMTASGTAIGPGAVTTIRDGINGVVSVSEGIGPGNGNIYTITFGGDLANQDLQQMSVSAADGTLPTLATSQNGGGGLNEVQTVSVVAATGSYTLSYKTQTTNPIPITAPSLLVQNELNALSLLTADVGSVAVSRIGNVYTILFGTAHSVDTPRLVATPLFAPLGTPEVTVSGSTDVDGYVSQASLVSLTQDNGWRGPVEMTSGGRIATSANSRINFLGALSDAANPSLAGSDLVKRGQGEVVLGALNTYRGTTWVDEGIATAANSGAFGTTAGGTIVANNAQLQIQGSLTIAGEALTIQGTGVPQASTLQDQWFNVGPAPSNRVPTSGNQSTSGRITSVATDPTDPNVIYIATAGGGAWKTKDRGVSWVPLFDDTVDAAAVMYGGSVYVAPSNPNVVYFATGEGNGGPNGSPIGGQRDAFAGTGIYKSINAGATWTLVTGPGSNNPIYGLVVTKLIVDPTNADRIYVATGTSSVINGGVQQIANNVFASAVPGVYRYDGSAATPDWVNLTGLPSPNRSSVVGQAPFDEAAPGDAGPDDDYRIAFPQESATWSDIALVAAARSPLLYGANAANTVAGTVWVLYAALGESIQAYGSNDDPGVRGVFNAVYRTEDPANIFAAGQGPTWWIGNGSIYPVAEGSTTEAPQDLPEIDEVTEPDQRGINNYYEVGPIVPPNPFHQPGRNEWIKISAVVTRYFNVDPANGSSNLLGSNRTMNASIQVYASNLGNSVDQWPWANPGIPHAGELLEFQRSGWDGGLATDWTQGINAEGAGFSSTPYGSNSSGIALGRYANTLISPSNTFGLLDTTANINTRLYLGARNEVWSVDGIRATATPTWTAITANTPADYFHALYIDRSTGNLLVGSDSGLLYDTTNFTTHSFQNLNGNLATTQFNNVDPHPTDINQMLGAAYNNGLQSFNRNLAWSGLTLPSTGDDRTRNGGDIRYDPKNPLVAFASAGGNLYRTQNGGQTWTFLRTGSGSNYFPVYVDPINPNRVLIGGSGLLETTNSGAASPAFTDLQGGGTVAMAPAVYQGEFVADPAFPLVTDRLSNTYDPDTIYVTDGVTVRVTKNHGTTWVARSPFANYFPYEIEFGGALAGTDVQQISVQPPGLPGGGNIQIATVVDGGVGGNEIQSMVVVANSGQYRLRVRVPGTPQSQQLTAFIPFNATTQQVQDAINAVPAMVAVGGTVTVTTGTTNNVITDIAVDPGNRDTVYATVRQRDGALGLPSVFRTTDAGRTWTDISGNAATAASVSYENNTPVNIPSGPTGATSTVTVAAPAGDVVTNVNVTINIQTDADSDMRVYLRGPNGARVPLVLNRGGGFAGDVDFTNTTFSDSAATPIANGTAPFTGVFRPESPLSSFNGIDPIGITGGVWTLEVFDDAALDPAILLDWTLELTTAPKSVGSLPYTQTWTVAVDPRTDTIYVGNDQGVWRLPNASATTSYNWSRFGDGLPDVQVRDLVLNQTLNTLTAATYGRGAYQLLLTDYQPSPGAIRVISGNSTWTGPVDITGDITITADGTQAIQNGIAAASLDFLGTITDTTAGNTSTITKTGLGTIIFSGSNSYGGQTLVQQGVLRVKNPNALGVASPTANTIVAAGAALELASDLEAEPVRINGDGFQFNGHYSGALRSVANNNVYTGPLTLGTNATIGVDPGNDQDTVINPGVRTDSSLRIGADPKGVLSGIGTISDLGNNFKLDKELAGTLILGSANTIGGEIRVVQGALRVEDANALGSFGPFAGTRVLDGAQMQMSRNAVTLQPTVVENEPLSLSGAGIDVTGALRNVRGDAATTGSNDNTWRGPITFTIDAGFSPQTNPGSRIVIRVDDSLIPSVIDTLNIDTNIQESSAQAQFGLIKVGPGRLNLMQDNSFTGTTEVGVHIGGRDFPGGSLRIESPNSLGPNALSNSVQTLSVVGLTGTYQLQFSGQTTSTLNATSTAQQVENALNALSSIGQAEQQTISVTGTGSYTLTFNGQTTGAIAHSATAGQIQTALNALSSVRRSEIQDVLVAGNSGFFTLTFNGERTGPLAYNASNGQVQTALNALASIFPTGSVNVTTSPTLVPGGTVYRIQFGGSLANSDQSLIVAEPYISDTVQQGTSGSTEIQTVAVFSTEGTYNLSFNGLTTIPLRFNATAAEVQAALNALPSIGGVNGSVAVTAAPFGTGTQFTIVFGGSLTDQNVEQITASGAGGPVTSVKTIQDGLGGSVTVSGAAPNYTVTFGGDLAARDVPLMTAANATGTANATIATSRPGAGVIVSETPTVNGKVLTVTFQRPLDLAVIPQIQSVNVSSGFAVNVATVQQGGAGAIVNNTGAPASLEIAGDPLNLDSSINVTRNLVLYGTGVTGGVNVTAVPVAGGTEYTLNFDGALGKTNVPLVIATGAGGASAAVASVQDGSRDQNEIQKVTVTGGAGTFTISLNGVTTAPIPFNATAGDVQTALNALTSIGAPAGALINVNGNNTYSGTVTLGTNTLIGVNPSTSLSIPFLQDPTPLTVPAPTLTKVGQGTLIFPNANAYGGLTTVRDGVLSIQHPQGIGSGRNEVQVFSTIGSTGAFTITFNGQTTVPLLFNVPASGGVNPADSVQNALNALSSIRRNEVQTVALSGSSSGTFTLTFNGQTTSPLAFNVPASGGVGPTASVQNALAALSTIGAGNVLVTGASPNYTITFVGALANQDLTPIAATGFGGTTAVAAVTQDGLGGTATVTSVLIPGGRQYTVTFGGDLANMNLPELSTNSAMVFTNTTTNGSATANEVQTVQTFVTGGQTFTLSFNYNGINSTTGALAAGATGAQVEAALEGLSSIRHNEIQDLAVFGTSGTFTITVTTPLGTRTTAPLAFNISAAALQTQLEGLSNIGVGNVTVGISPITVTGGTNFRITFTGLLGFQNIPTMTASGAGGAVTNVVPIQDGLGGDVTVILTGVPGNFLYTITFGGDLANTNVPQITGTSSTNASYIAPRTVVDGNGAETQYVQVTATNGTFFLTFRGQTTSPLLFNATAADVERALNTLTTIGGIGGFVRVTKAGANDGPGGAVYTVSFGGTLAAENLPPLTATTTGGTVVVITTGNNGPEGTTVLNGATLQLNGDMVMDREVITINGQGFQNQGALNVKAGNVTWQAFSPLQQIPLFLGSDASLGTTLPTDNLTFLLPISDQGAAHDLDIYGPGTVTYAANGPASFGGYPPFTQYTGTTTVHEGLLLLSQPPGGAILGPLVVGDGVGPANSATVRLTINNQIADTSTVLVNSDGFLDVNSRTETISDLTIVGGRVDTGTGGQFTTGVVDMTGGLINIGNNALVNSKNVTMRSGAAIVGGNSGTLLADNLDMSASTISFGTSGILSVDDVVMAGGSTIDFGDSGLFNAANVTATGGHVAFGNNGIFNALNVSGSNTDFTFALNGAMSVVDLTLTNTGSLVMGNFGSLAASGNILLDNSTMAFGDNGIASAAGTLTVQNASQITFGLVGQLAANGTTLADSIVTMGDGAVMTTGNLLATNSTVNLGVGVAAGSSLLTAGTVNGTNSQFNFGDNAVFSASDVTLAGGGIDFGDTGHLNASGNVHLTGASVEFNNAGRLDAVDLTALLGSLIEFLLSGILNVDEFVMGASQLLMGDSALVSASRFDFTDSDATLGNSSVMNSAGTLDLTGSDLALGTDGLLQVGDVTMDAGADASHIAIGDGSTALLGNMNVAGGSFTAGNSTTVNAGDITDNGTDFIFGNTAILNAGLVSVSNAKIEFGTDGTFNTSGDFALDNATVTLGDGVSILPAFSTQNVSMVNGSKITLGADTQGSSLGISMTGSTIALGTNAVHTLGGNIFATSITGVSSEILGPGTLDVGTLDRTVNVADGPEPIDLSITAEIASTPTERLIKTGPGRLRFAPAAAFASPISIQAGDVQVDTTIGPVNMTNTAGSLSGNGTVGVIDGAPPIGASAVGTVSPGVNWSANPAGILHAGTSVWGANTTYFVNIGGPPIAGTTYDQLQVTGDISLNGAKLEGLFGTGVTLGDQFTIIQTSGGSVLGRFAEPFGANVAFVDGQKFSVQYNPTSVVLTKILANIVAMDVTASINPATQRQPVILTATMTPEPGAGAIPNTSTVTFTFTNTTTLATYTGTVNVGGGNQALFNTNQDIVGNTFLPGGTYSVQATFNGDPVNFTTASAGLATNLVIEIPTLNTLTGAPAIISPNQSAGIQDAIDLAVTVLNERGSVDWTFTILDSTNSPVRTITGTGGTGGSHTSVPINAVWDGTDDSSAFVPDGDYTVSVSFTDEFGNTGSSNVLSIVVDNVNPTATSLTNSNILIAPGVPGVSLPPSTQFTSTVGDPAFPGHPNGTFDHWTITITSGSTTVRTFTGTNTNVDVTWDGTDASSTIVPDAAYTVTLTSYDAAGNSFSAAPQTVVVLTHPPTIVASSNTPTVYGQSITMSVTVSLPAGTPTSVTSLLDGNPVEFYKDATTLLGSGNLSLIGGEYRAVLTVPTFNAGTYNSLFVRYLGTSNFLAGDSATITHVVTPAPLTVTASQTVTKQYGDPVPPLDLASGHLAVSGLVNGDLAADVITGSAATTATQASPVIASGYPITQGTIASNSNYSLTFVDGKLTVTKAPLTVIIDDAQRPYHGPNPTFTFTAETLLLGDSPSVVTGLSLSTTANVNSPPGAYPITATGTPVAQNYDIVEIVPGVLEVIPIPTSVAIGPGSGIGPTVKIYSPSGVLQSTFTAFDPAFTGGVRTATGDFNRDGVLDVAVGTGPGAVAFVRIIDGATGTDMFSVFPFESFTGGVFVAAGDIDGDGADEIVISPDQGGGPRVVAYQGMTFTPLISFFGINDPNFRGGARAAVGDMNGDGYADVAVSAGFQGGPRISIWDGKALAVKQFKNLTSDFFAFDPSLRNGAYVAIGDVDGDGKGDLITGAGPGGAPHVKIFSGADLLNPSIGSVATQLISNFFAGDPGNRGGVRVAVKSLDDDLRADLVTGVGDNGGSTATAYLGVNLINQDYTHFFDVDPFPGFNNGVFVG